MAISKNGLTGHFYGPVGSVSGSKWKGLYIIRSKRRRSKKKPTEKQQEQQRKFGDLSALLHLFKSLIEIGFKNFKKKKASMPMATAMKNNALRNIIGGGPNYEVDLSKVILSMGNLFRTTGAKLIPGPNKRMQLTWNDDEEHWSDQHALQRGSDYLMVAALFKTKSGNFVSDFSGSARRRDLAFDMRFRSALRTEPIHLWIFFFSEDEKSVSKSEYFTAMLSED